MKNREKELGTKKVRISSHGCLHRCKLGPIAVSYSEENCNKILSKEDIELLVKSKNFKKNLIEN